MSFLGRDERGTNDPAASQSSNPFARRMAATSAATAPTQPATDAVEAKAPAARAIGRLEKFGAEQLWPDQDEFVTWLRSNLEPLGEAIGMELMSAATSEIAGSSNAFLAAERGGTPVIVVVELGASTDDRFGVLLRQMVASAAKTAVWVTGQPRPDHTASVSWLNRAVDGRFFVVRVEAVKIGDSAAAPVFNAAVRPPRATDAIDDASRLAGAAPDGRPGRRAEDWLETATAEEAGA